MKRRRLGRTEHESSVAILGCAAFWQADPGKTEAAIEAAIERGVNHFDIAPRYGEAESLVGPFIPDIRSDIFLGCKTTRRQPEGVRAQLEHSLELLRTDHLDLYQLHAVTSVAVLDERAGAVETILGAREEGLTRFVGITGHDLETPRAQLEALRRWDLDTVMFPVSPGLWNIPSYREDAEALLEECGKHDVGVMAIKSVARRPWGERERFASTWYEPHTDPDAITRGVHFALSVPGVHAICTPGELSLLPGCYAAADDFEQLGESERNAAVRESRDFECMFPLAEHA